MNAGVVRVQVHDTLLKTGNGQRVADKPRTVERAQNLAPGVGGHDEQGHRLDFHVGFAPDFALQRYAVVEVFQGVAFADDDAAAHREGPALCAAPTRVVRGTVLLVEPASFAEFQRASFSGRGTSSNLRPLCAARRSISWKRRTNFALAFFRAISGS